MGLLPLPRPPCLLGWCKSLGSTHEGREERDRGDRSADERAYHLPPLTTQSFYHAAGGAACPVRRRWRDRAMFLLGNMVLQNRSVTSEVCRVQFFALRAVLFLMEYSFKEPRQQKASRIICQQNGDHRSSAFCSQTATRLADVCLCPRCHRSKNFSDPACLDHSIHGPHSIRRCGTGSNDFSSRQARVDDGSAACRDSTLAIGHACSLRVM